MPYCHEESCHRWRPEPLVRYARLGLRVDGTWFCSAACVAAATEARLRAVESPSEVAVSTPPIRTGSFLVHAGVITSAQLKEALTSQTVSGLRIGAELRRLGYVDAESVLRALAAQTSMKYLRAVDPVSVRQAPGGLSADEVRALGLVPIRTETKNGTDLVVVACTAPVPRAAIGALQALTGFAVVAYLVSDENLDALMVAYAADVPADQARIRVQWVDGVHDAARRISDVASNAHDVTMRQGVLEPLTWIRVAGKHGIDALFMTPDRDRKEASPWLVGTTPH